MAFVYYGRFKAEMDYYGDQEKMLDMASYRRMYAMELLQNVRSLSLQALEIPTLYSEERLRNATEHAADRLYEIAFEVDENACASSPEQCELVNEPSINAQLLVNAGSQKEHVETSVMNLRTFVSKYAYSALMVASMPPRSISLHDVDAFFVLSNGVEMVAQLNMSTELYAQTIEHHADGLNSMSLGFMIAGVVVMFVLIGGIMFPVVSMVLTVRQQVLRIFFSMPRVLRRRFHAYFESRLAIMEEDDGGDSDLGSWEGLDASALKLDKERGEKIQFAGSLLVKIRVLAKMSPIFLIFVLFFVLAHTVALESIRRDLQGTPHAINYAGYRAAAGKEVLYLQRELALSNSEHALPDTPLATAFSQLDLLKDVSHAIQFGDRERFGIYSDSVVANDMKPELRRMMFEDACLSFSPADCRTHDGGIMARGLENAVQHWYHDVLVTMNYVERMLNSTSPETLLPRLYADEKTETDYLDAVLLEQTHEIVEQFEVQKEKSLNAMTAMLVLTVIAVVLLYVLLFRSIVRSLRSQIRQAYSTLLLVPAPLLIHLDVLDAFQDKRSSSLC